MKPAMRRRYPLCLVLFLASKTWKEDLRIRASFHRTFQKPWRIQTASKTNGTLQIQGRDARCQESFISFSAGPCKPLGRVAYSTGQYTLLSLVFIVSSVLSIVHEVYGLTTSTYMQPVWANTTVLYQSVPIDRDSCWGFKFFINAWSEFIRCDPNSQAVIAFDIDVHVPVLSYLCAAKHCPQFSWWQYSGQWVR